jgi:hypothetical protein
MKVLIEPEWCSKTFEPKLRQVVLDSICPSSKLNDEQCERLVSTLVNPDTLSKIVNEIVVTSLLKNLNVSLVVFIILKFSYKHVIHRLSQKKS